MNQSSRIIFFGNERLSSGYQPDGSPTLRTLLGGGYEVVAVVASHHEATSRNKRKLEVQEFAERNNIPVLLPDKPGDIIDDLKALKPELGVLVAYGKIVPQEVIDIFPCGIVNIHPSLLPAYRGSTPIEQAILDGVSKTGVSLMKLVKAMDAGPVFEQGTVDLNGTESKQDLTTTLLNLGVKLLIKNLPRIIDRSLEPVQQDETKVTYCKLIKKADGDMQTSKPASVLEKEVRAYLGWPKSRLNVFDLSVIVTKAHVVAQKGSGGLVVDCSDGTFLEVDELIAPSGRKMSGADFMRGYKK